MPRAQVITLLLVCLSAVPIAGTALWSIGYTVTEVLDPCKSWEYPPEQPISIQIGPHDPCRAITAHTESKAHALIRAATVPGGMLVASMLALAGVVLSRRRLLITAGIGMLGQTLFVLSIAPLTFVAGLSFIVLARRLQPTLQAGSG
jgi:hypothetical protein